MKIKLLSRLSKALELWPKGVEWGGNERATY